MRRVLWDVDTQVDFVHADGKLAVPGAEAAVPAMAELVVWAREAGIPHIASADDHELSDAEISDTPDFATTYPPHCLRGTRGAEKIAETRQDDPVPLALTPVADHYLEGREFLLLKKSFDVFTNPHADRLLELLDPQEIVLFGVATDVCNDAAIRGLLARGRNVTFVESASRGLDEARTASCLARWRESGVRFSSGIPLPMGE
ncbi:MAG TPA: cysteine hydrolase family protein [Gaiellaceae bacterium]|jgi:nicotinamidase/pyrazinamidase|nr:cysteine hydrolase family protein [Gaiellaceae bacterium]